MHKLSETNSLLEMLIKRLDQQDQSIELTKALCSNSILTSTPKQNKINRQKEVPLQIQVSMQLAMYSYYPGI